MIPTSDTDAPRTFRFQSQGLLAIDPQAFGLVFEMFAEPEAPFEIVGDCAIVKIDGPLATSGPFCDTYSRIRGRVAAALASEARNVVMRVSSPGGDVFGCFDTSRALRAMARASGKKLIGHTEANACSSAYALISAADEICASDSSVLGSIGVIATAVDASQQAEAAGLRFTILTSGKRKADGNPMVEMTKEARVAMQGGVDAMAAVFFGLVKEHRGIDAAPLEAATFVGAAALEAKLCDRVESFDEMLARLNAGDVKSEEPKVEGAMLDTSTAQARATSEGHAAMSDEKKNDSDARKALAAASAKGDARATKALKAYDENEDSKAEDEKKEPEAADEKKEPEAADEEPKNDEKEKAKAQAAAILASHAASSAPSAREQKLEAELRDALFASRPDLPETFRAACAKLDTDTIKELLAAHPAPKRSAVSPLPATPARAPVKGEGGGNVSPVSAEEAARMDRAMGLATFAEAAAVEDGVVQSFGVRRQKVSQ